jgi:long-subunit acyl-CoA synthetase (AMP-forming)
MPRASPSGKRTSASGSPSPGRSTTSAACHFGLGLRALGLPEGGHVGVISENRIEWVLAQMGAGLVGAVTVGVYPTSPSPEVAYVVGHADIEIMVCEDQEQTDKVLEALDDLPRLKKIVVMETKGLRSFAPEHAASSSPLTRWSNWARQAASCRTWRPRWRASKLWTTSG